jgi:hypothetical protein
MYGIKTTKGDALDKAKQAPIPKSLRLNTHSTIQSGIKRIEIEVDSDKQTINPNTQCSFILPQGMLLNGKNRPIRFRGEFTFSKTGGSFVRPHNGILSLIRRLRVFVGSVCVSDTDQYGVLSALAHNYRYSQDWFDGNGYLSGYGSQAQRNAFGAASSTWFEFELLENLFRQNLPVFKNEARIKVEIHWEDPSKCIETDGTSPSYQITNAQLRCSGLYLDNPEQVAAMTRNVVCAFENYRVQQHILTAGLTTSSVKLNVMLRDCTAIAFCMLNDANLTDPTSNDRLSTFARNGLSRAELKINGSLVVFTGHGQDYSRNDGMWEAKSIWGLSANDRSLASTYTAFQTDKFLGAFNLSPVVKDEVAHEKSQDITIGGGMPLDHNCTLELTFASALAAQQSLYVIYFYNSSVTYEGDMVSWQE